MQISVDLLRDIWTIIKLQPIIVGLNVAPKEALPFSRGKRVVSRRIDTPKTRQRTTTAPNIKYNILLFYSKLIKSAFSTIESIKATNISGNKHKTIPQPFPPSSIPSNS